MWEAVATGSDGASSHQEAFIQKLKRANVPYGIVQTIRRLLSECAFEQHNGESLPLPANISDETAWHAYETLQKNNIKQSRDIPDALLRREHVPEWIIVQLRSLVRGMMTDPTLAASMTIYVGGFGVAAATGERPISPSPPSTPSPPPAPQRSMEAEVFLAPPPSGATGETQEKKIAQPAAPKMDKLKKSPKSSPTPTKEVSIFPVRRSKIGLTPAQRRHARQKRRNGDNGDIETVEQMVVEEPPHKTAVRKHLDKTVWTWEEAVELLCWGGSHFDRRNKDYVFKGPNGTESIGHRAVNANQIFKWDLWRLLQTADLALVAEHLPADAEK